MIGRSIGHYKVVEKLGQGGMGEVYRAVDTMLGRQVAIKMLPSTLAKDENRLGRLKREAQVLASLDHPNIVRIYGVDEFEGVPYLAMEFIDGKTLLDYIPSEGVTLHEFFEISIPLAEALSVAHERGIVHRDLKPGNIMVSREGQVKVLDFGLAKVRQLPGEEIDEDASTEALTAEGRVLGTMPYMAPEQVQGLPVDQRSDIFSLGIVLYQLATGHRPFKGTNSAELISSIMRDDPDPVDELKREMPHHLGRIIRQCLEKEPENRLDSANTVRIQLQDLRREMTTQRGSASASQPRFELEQETGREGSSIGWWPVALAAVAVLLAVVLWISVRGPNDPEAGLEPETRALVQQAELYEQRGDTRQNFSEAEQRYRRALKLEPESAFIQARLASLLARIQRQYPEAERPEEVRQLARGALAANDDLAPAHVALGTLALLEGDAVEAGRQARSAIAADAAHYAGYALHGEALVAEERVDEGLVELRRAVELAGTNLVARATMARVLKDLGRYSEAAAEYEEILEFDPDQPTALNNLAVIYMRTGRDVDAIPLLTRALRLEEDEAAASNLGAIQFELGNVDKAIASYRQAYRIAPEKPYAAYNLGEAFELLGESESSREWYERALVNFDRALEAGGPRSLMLSYRALCAVKLGRTDEALDNVREAIELEPGNTQRIFVAAQVAALAGNKELLLDYARDAIALGHPRQDFFTDSAFVAFQEDAEFLALLEAESVG